MRLPQQIHFFKGDFLATFTTTDLSWQGGSFFVLLLLFYYNYFIYINLNMKNYTAKMTLLLIIIIPINPYGWPEKML